jgi:hypothetical protein
MFFPLLRLTKPIAAPALEAYYRARDRFALAFLALSGKSTVKACLGSEHLTSGQVVIFASYPDERLSMSHVDALDRFHDRGYSIIVATNHPNPSAAFGGVDRPWCFLHRLPYGRDFGCYKDSLTLLYRLHDEGKIKLGRVVLLNDSVATLPGPSQCVVDHLADEENNFAGITENYHPKQHVGSFMVALSAAVLLHPRVRQYWEDYVPLSTRRYSIRKGELGLSRAVRRAGFVPQVKFSLAQLKITMQALDFPRLMLLAEAMEPHFRASLRHPMALVDNALLRNISPVSWLMGRSPSRKKRSSMPQFDLGQDTKSSISESLVAGALLTGNHEDYEQKLRSIVRLRESFLGVSAPQQAAMISHTSKEKFIDSLLKYVFRGSNIHHGAAVLLFAGAGIIKKDVVFRRIVEPFNVISLLRESSPTVDLETIHEIASEILAKGHPYSLRGWQKLLYDWDFI